MNLPVCVACVRLYCFVCCCVRLCSGFRRTLGPTSTSGYTRGTINSHTSTSSLNFWGTAVKHFIGGMNLKSEWKIKCSNI